MSKAEAALEAAEQEHEAIVTEIEKDRAALDKRAARKKLAGLKS
jgi:colicin import membrane protein